MVVSKANEPSPKRQRLSSKMEKPRHYDELANIQDAQVEGDSLGSPAIRNALNDFLSTRKLSTAMSAKIQKALHEMKTSLDKLSKEHSTFAAKSKPVSNLLRKLEPNVDPNSHFRSPQSNTLSIECSPPTNVNVVGSYLLGYSSSNIADVAVQMPSSLFQSKDIFNYKYHDKRLLYILYLAHHLISEKNEMWINASISTHFLGGDMDKPTLSISHKDFPQITIRLIPTYATDVFEHARLGDNRKNLRPAGISSIVENKSEATISYNHSILADSIAVPNLQILHSLTSKTPNFTDAVLLLEAWSIRHRFNLTKFIFAVLIADLLTRAIVPPRASREHILRCAFNALRSHVLDRLTINNVLICASRSKAQRARIAQCAATALVIIESKTAADDPWNGVVPNLFATARGTKAAPHPITSLFDGFIRIRDKSGMRLTRTTIEKLEKVLHTGFVDTQRISCLERIENGLYGLTFVSHDNLVRKVDIIGSSTDAKEFKEFWGPKTSLRRFKDGKIAESVVWSGGMRTLNEIAQYLLDRHFSSGHEKLECKVFVGELEEASKISDSDIVTTNQAISAFNELATLLRSVDGLPLKIHGVHATSPHLRRCGMYGIRPNKANRFMEPLDIVATFESSNAWPDDAVALAASKAAFYIGLRTKLMEQGINAFATISYLEIFVGGFVFWLRLKVQKEYDLLEDSEEGKKLWWETETLVRHHDDIRNIENTMMTQMCRIAKRWLNSQMMFRCMGERRDSVVELLVAGVMCHSLTGRVKSTMRGFCQFLYMLAEYPWEVCPLVVSFPSEEDEDMNNDDDDDDNWRQSNSLADKKRCEALEQAQKHFNQSSDVFGIYAAHGELIEPWLTGDNKMETVIARRIRMTAKAALHYIEDYVVNLNEKQQQQQQSSMKTLFCTDVDNFDVTLNIDPSACIMRPESATACFGVSKTVNKWLAGFDPMERVWTYLEQRLGKYAMFLGQMRGGADIHVVWRPAVEKRVTKFALRDSAFCDFGENGELKLSKQQLVEEIKHIGQGLIADVTVRN